MKNARFASCITTIFAIAVLAGCAKQEAASVSTEPTAAGDAAAAPESDSSATAAPAEEAPAAGDAAPKD